MAKRTWTTKAQEVVFTTDATTGALMASVPLYRDGVKHLTIQLDVSQEGNVDVLVLRGSPDSVLQGFRARSDF